MPAAVVVAPADVADGLAGIRLGAEAALAVGRAALGVARAGLAQDLAATSRQDGAGASAAGSGAALRSRAAGLADILADAVGAGAVVAVVETAVGVAAARSAVRLTEVRRGTDGAVADAAAARHARDAGCARLHAGENATTTAAATPAGAAVGARVATAAAATTTTTTTTGRSAPRTSGSRATTRRGAQCEQGADGTEGEERSRGLHRRCPLRSVGACSSPRNRIDHSGNRAGCRRCGSALVAHAIGQSARKAAAVCLRFRRACPARASCRCIGHARRVRPRSHWVNF